MLAPHRLAPATTAVKRRLLPTAWISACVVLFLMLGCISPALAATNGTWIDATNGGLWSTTADWSGGTVANGSGGIADFSTLNITADDTVHLDTARIIGQLKFGDTTPSNNWTLDNDGNALNVLTLAVSAGSPTITVVNDTNTISATMAGTQGFTSNGSGVLVVSGNNTFTGNVAISAGTLALGSANALGSTANNVSISNGATLDLAGQTVGANPLAILGAGVGGNGALINSSSSPASFAGTVNASGPFTVGGTGDITLSGSVNGGNQVLTKIGNNTLTLSGTADNNGLAVTVNSGTVVLAKTSSGSPNDVHAIGEDTLTVNGGTAQLGGTGGDQIYDLGSVTVTSGSFDTNGRNEAFENLSLQGTGIGGAGALVNSAAAFSAITPTGGTTLTGNATIGVTQSTGELQLNSAIGGSFALTKTGSGTLLLAGNNTFTGGLTISGGTLQVGNPGALNSSSPNSVAFSSNSSGTLSLNGNNVTVSGLTTSAVVGTPVVQNANAIPATLTVNNSAANTFAGTLQDGPGGGSLGLMISGGGTLTLSGNNTFTGGLLIQAGTLRADSATALGSTSNNVSVSNGATLDLGGQAVGANLLALAGGVGGNLINNSSNPASYAGNITGDDSFSMIGGNGQITLSGSVSNPSPPNVFALTKIGSDTLILSGTTDNFNLGVVVDAGTVILAKTSSGSPNVHAIGQPGLFIEGGLAQLGGTGGDQIYDLAPVTVASGALDINGLSETFASLNLQGIGIGGAGALVNSAAAFSVITPTGGTTLTGNATIGVTQSTGELQLNNAIGGNFALTKVGAGTLLLAGNNTFTGTVAIGAGTLALGSASALGSTANNVNVSNGATLDLGGQTVGANPLTLSGAGVGGNGALNNSSANPASYAGNVTLTGPTSAGGNGQITLGGTVGVNIQTLTKIDGNTLILSGTTDNSNLGVTVNDGTVILAKTSSSSPDIHAVGETGLTVNGGTAQLGGTGGDQIYDLANVTVTSGTFDTNGRSETFAKLFLQGTGNGSAGALRLTGSNLFSTITPTSGTVLTGNATIGVDSQGSELTLNDAVSGNFTVTKTGLGILALNGTNTFSGGLTVQQGLILVPTINNASTNGPLGNNTFVTLGSSGQTGTLDFVNASASSNMPFVLAAGGTGAFELDQAVTTVALNGVISGSGSLAMTGNGTLILDANNKFTGGVTIGGGTLQLGNPGALNSIAPNSVKFSSGSNGTLSLNGNSVTVSGLTTSAVVGTPVVQDGNTASATLTVNNSTDNTFAGTLQDGPGGGSLGLVKSGGGTLTLSGNNTLTGNLAIQAGTLRAGSATALGSTANNVNVSTAATLDLAGQMIGANPMAILGAGVGDNGALVNSSANAASYAGAITGNNGPASIGGNGQITLSGSVSNTIAPNVFQLTKIGSNTLVLSGTTDNFNLALVINSGTVVLAKTSSGAPHDVHAIGQPGLTINGGLAQLGGTGGDQIYDLGSVIVTSGSFDTNGRNESFANLSLQGTGIGGAGALVNSAAAFSAITPTGGTTLSGDVTIGVTQSTGELQLNNGTSVTAALTKVGAGTLVLNGNPTLNANSSLLVNGGTLRFNVVSGAAAIGTGVTATIASSATLELAGSVSALSSGGGAPAPAGRVNILNTSAVPGVLVSGTNQQVGNIDGSGTMQVNAGSDLTANHIVQAALVIGGTVGSPGLVTIDASDASGNPLATGPSILGSLASGSPLGDLVSSAVLSSDSTTIGFGSVAPAPGNLATAAGTAAVPEPSTLILLAIGGLAGGLAIARQRRNCADFQA